VARAGRRDLPPRSATASRAAATSLGAGPCRPGCAPLSRCAAPCPRPASTALPTRHVARLVATTCASTCPPGGRAGATLHVPQKPHCFGNEDRRNRPHAADFLLGSVSSTVPENRSVVS
jgi:hypothetical protein